LHAGAVVLELPGDLGRERAQDAGLGQREHPVALGGLGDLVLNDPPLGGFLELGRGAELVLEALAVVAEVEHVLGEVGGGDGAGRETEPAHPAGVGVAGGSRDLTERQQHPAQHAAGGVDLEVDGGREVDETHVHAGTP
jgi:hypothetical protein